MDLNYLYHRHGTSLSLAKLASCARSRSAHRELASAYAAKIDVILKSNVVAAA